MEFKVDGHQSFTLISHCFGKINLITSSLQLENNVPPLEARGSEIECFLMGQMVQQEKVKAKTSASI